jgi:hypothetical protein
MVQGHEGALPASLKLCWPKGATGQRYNGAMGQRCNGTQNMNLKTLPKNYYTILIRESQ